MAEISPNTKMTPTLPSIPATKVSESGTLGVRSSPIPLGGGGSTGNTPIIARRVDHVHKLERKHSSGDLHSRLKTRKLLGVGETDDGDVHRSKLSQILGHSEQLYVKLPRGLRAWQLLTALMFSITGAWALAFPGHLFSFTMNSVADDSAILPIRLYGGALISLSMMFWCTLQTVDKDIIRLSLMGSAVYFIIQIFVTGTWLYQHGRLLQKGPALLFHHVVFGTISLVYHWAVGLKGSSQSSRIRCANSSSDVNKRQ